MSKVYKPLLSYNAGGIFGRRIVFQRENVGTQCRINLPQKDPLTPPQTVMRLYYKTAQEQYRQLYGPLWDYYKSLADKLNLSTQQYFTKDYFSLQTIARYGYARYGVSRYR